MTMATSHFRWMAMCFARTAKQPVMGNPAGYPVNEAFGQVRQSVTGPDGTKKPITNKPAAKPVAGPMVTR